MIQLLAAKTYLKKAYVWLKNYWYVPFSVMFAIVTWFFYRQKSAMLAENLKATRESHKKEIEEVNKVHEKHISERQNRVDLYRSNRDALDKSKAEKEAKAKADQEARKEELKKKEIHAIAEELKKFHKETKG
jgi:hypothetical protein